MEKLKIGYNDCQCIKHIVQFLVDKGYSLTSFLLFAPKNQDVLLFCEHFLKYHKIREIGHAFRKQKFVFYKKKKPVVVWENTKFVKLPFPPSSFLNLLETEEKSSYNFERKNYLILIIEDSPTTTKALQSELEALGFQTMVADGFLSVSKLLKHEPDMVVLDLELPGLSGERLGALLKNENLPIVLYSSSDPDRLEQAKQSLDAFEAFSKSHSPSEIALWIRDFFEGFQTILKGDIFKWTPDIESGDEILDTQHKQFIHHVHLFWRSLKQKRNHHTLDYLLSSFEDYVRVHFRFEEQLMTKVQYPNLREHELKHREYTQKLRETFRLIRKQGTTNALLIRLWFILINFFQVHVMRYDKEFAYYLRKYRENPK